MVRGSVFGSFTDEQEELCKLILESPLRSCWGCLCPNYTRFPLLAVAFLPPQLRPTHKLTQYIYSAQVHQQADEAAHL